MGEEAMIAAAGVEVVKLLLTYAIQAAQKAGMTTEQVLALYLSEKEKLAANDPAKIPDPK